jgi:hypothetical protein
LVKDLPCEHRRDPRTPWQDEALSSGRGAREIIDVLSPYRQSDGSYQLRNEFHFVIARA